MKGLQGFLILLSVTIFPILAVALEKPTIQVQSNCVRQLEIGWNYFEVLPGYRDDSAHIYMICAAFYPIQWNYTGLFSSPALEVDGILALNNTENGPIYGLITTLSEARKYVYSVRVTCYSIEEPSMFAEVFFFHWDGVASSLLHPVENTTINSKTILCPTLTPRVPVQLYLETENGTYKNVKRLDTSLVYHPLDGFLSSFVFEGVYTCVQGFYTVSVTAISTSSDTYQFFPRNKSLLVFDEDVIHLECLSSSAGNSLEISIHDIISFTSPMKLDNETATANNSALNVSIQKNSTHVRADIYALVDVKYGIKGKATCIDYIHHRNETKTIKEWNFEFVSTPVIRINRKHRKIECMASSRIKMYVMWCEDIKKCSLCRHQFSKGIIECKATNKDTSLTYSARNNGPYIGSTKYSDFVGLVFCQAFGTSLVKIWDVLETLDREKYLSWMNAPAEELMRIDKVPYVLYTNSTSKFTCETLKYLFPKKPEFRIQFENGSLADANATQIFYNISTKHKAGNNTRSVENLNVITVLYIELPIDAVAIHCVARWWNSSETFSTSRKFETRHLMPPTFPTGEDLDASSSKETFIIGESNRRLACIAEGEPIPQIRWLFNGTDALTVFPELQINVCENGKCYLEFPLIDQNKGRKFAGEYLCKASNVVGEESREILLEIAESSNHLSVTYISTSVVSGLIAFALVVAVVVFVGRYRNNKYLLRNLTQDEIDDFFEGRPAMVVNGASIEAVELMPFKRDFEISLSDLHFTFSEASLLGTGEFAFVVRGLILSAGRPVALKICKPSTDVRLFKSLLSEVKIMTHIGQHENVLSLIGVCTEEIRCRSLYVITDICELGSLKTFLQKEKPNFLSLTNSNQEIDVSLSSQDLNRQDWVTTLDLISFSAQIAKGMEFLAYKSVVHADLAARNVLLTSNRTAKISDFGLSKKLYESTDYVKKSKTPLPWRWMALESLETLTFSTKSDVWSYGVTLYEIFTLGNAPFPNERWSQDFVKRLKGGMRMGRPEFSTSEIFTKIVACWENSPELRPEFGILHAFFEDMYRKYDVSSPEEENSAPTLQHCPMFSNTDHQQLHALYVNCNCLQEIIEMFPYANIDM